MSISFLYIIKNSFKFSAVRAIAILIGVPVTIYVATILTPEEYGLYGFLGLWLMYAGLIGPGILGAGSREVPVLLGREKEEEAARVQNVSISAELLYLVLPLAVILGASFFFSDPTIKFGLIIVAASYAASRLSACWSSINFVREKFNVVAKGNLIVAILAPVVILAGVNSLGVYTLLIGPLIANAVLWIYLLKRGRIGYRFTFHRTEVWRLLKVGIVLQALTFVFWAFRLADRTIIAATLPFEELGLYTYAMGFLMFALVLPTDIGKVMQPILWREAARTKSIFTGFSDTKRIAIYVALGVSVLIPAAQLVYYLVMNLITIKYIASITVFNVLSYNLYLASIVVIPGLILNSSIVNKQRITLFIYAIGLALNVVFDLLIIKLGYGIVGVAWVTICTQGLVTLILYCLIKGHIFKDTKEFLGFQARILFPFFIAIPFYLIHNYLDSVSSNVWSFAGVSLAAQAILWSLVIRIFYKDYISINDIRLLMREAITVMHQMKNRIYRNR